MKHHETGAQTDGGVRFTGQCAETESIVSGMADATAAVVATN
jgi:hypothetical protein